MNAENNKRHIKIYIDSSISRFHIYRRLSYWVKSVIIKFQNIVQSPIFSLGVEFLDMKSHDEVIKYALNGM